MLTKQSIETPGTLGLNCPLSQSLHLVHPTRGGMLEGWGRACLQAIIGHSTPQKFSSRAFSTNVILHYATAPAPAAVRMEDFPCEAIRYVTSRNDCVKVLMTYRNFSIIAHIGEQCCLARGTPCRSLLAS